MFMNASRGVRGDMDIWSFSSESPPPPPLLECGFPGPMQSPPPIPPFSSLTFTDDRASLVSLSLLKAFLVFVFSSVVILPSGSVPG